MILNEYNDLLREYFDFSDRQTTKFINYINESDQQSQLLAALAGALYDKIVAKCDKIDFGSIPRSRGDITKIDGYNNTVECINILRKLVVEYKEDPAIIDIELTAIENIKSLRPIFMKAFANNASFAMGYYNIIVASIQHSVSFLISVIVQFVKDPDTKNMVKALDKAAYKDAESNLLIENLAQINKSFATGQLEKILRDSISGGVRESVNDDEFTEDTISMTDDVTDAIDKAPEAESTPIGDKEISEDVMILKIAGGENEIEIEPNESEESNQEIAPSPFGDEASSDELAAGANNPDTLPDDEVDPTPTMPINGACSANVKQTVEEVQGNTVVNRPYHKHPNANANYSGVQEFGLGDIKTFLKTGSDYAANGGKKLWNMIPGGAIKWVALGVSGIYILIKYIIPKLRNFVSFLWTLKADLSESLAIQANLIELNAIELEQNTTSNLSDEKRAKVVDRQLKIAQKLRSLAEKFAIKDKRANSDAKKEIESDKKDSKQKISDIKDNLPDDLVTDSDLF